MQRFLKPTFFVVVIALLLIPTQLQSLTFSSAKAANSNFCTVVDKQTSNKFEGIQDGNGGCKVSSVLGGTQTYTQSDTRYTITNSDNGDFKDNGGNTMTKIADDGLGCGLGTISICLSNVVYVFTAGIMSVFAYVGGYVLSMGIALSLNSVAYAQSFLSVGWTAVRDIANIAFIFILLYLAFVVILQAETSGTIRTLAMVIIMALLINFSFFITRVVIDGGNILAVQFYNQIDAPSLNTSASQGGATGAIATVVGNFSPANTKDLTAGIMNVMRLQNLFSTASFTSWFQDQKGVGGGLNAVIVLSLLYITMGIMLAILAATFLFVGFKFILRLIVLWAVIIGAPIAFVARALTNSNKARALYHMWQDSLIKFSFYPAIFLFTYLIISYILQQIAGGAQNGALVSVLFSDLKAASNNSDSFAIVAGRSIGAMSIRLGIVVVMLYYGMRIADTLVDHGNGAARGFTSWMGQRIGGLTYGALGVAGRNTIGRGLQAGGAAAGQVASTRQTVVGQRLWSGIGKTATSVGTSSFDARTAIVRNTVKDVTGKTPTAQLDIGKGGRGGLLKTTRFPSGPQATPPTTPTPVILRTQTPAQQQAIDQVASAQSVREDQERRTIPAPANDNTPQPLPTVAGPNEQTRITQSNMQSQQNEVAATSMASGVPVTPRSSQPLSNTSITTSTQINQGSTQAPSIQFADSGRMRELLQSIRTNGTGLSQEAANENRASSPLSTTTLSVGANIINAAQSGFSANRGVTPSSEHPGASSQTVSSQDASAAARIAQASYRATPSAPGGPQTLWQSSLNEIEKKDDKKDVRAMLKELQGIRELLKRIASNPNNGHTLENKPPSLELKHLTFNPTEPPTQERGAGKENPPHTAA